MRLYFLVILLPFIWFSCQTKKASDYVNPFIGTGFHGHTYPGATTPFGAVQLSPDTRRGNWDACSGYHYSDSTIIGFSHTHLSGTGCIDLGDILLHPMITDIQKRNDGYLFDPIPFSHKNEQASVGYYAVKLENGIKAELTATQHVGVHRYMFPAEGKPKIVVDLAHLLDNETINEASLLIGDSEISGMRTTSGWVANQHIYFVAQFSQPFNAELVTGGEIIASAKEAKGGKLQAILNFTELKGKPVICKVGLSIVSVENARQNLQAETTDFDFDRIKAETASAWEKKLAA